MGRCGHPYQLKQCCWPGPQIPALLPLPKVQTARLKTPGDCVWLVASLLTRLYLIIYFYIFVMGDSQWPFRGLKVRVRSSSVCALSAHASSIFVGQRATFNCDSWGLKEKTTVGHKHMKFGKVSLPGEDVADRAWLLCPRQIIRWDAALTSPSNSGNFKVRYPFFRSHQIVTAADFCFFAYLFSVAEYVQELLPGSCPEFIVSIRHPPARLYLGNADQLTQKGLLG